MCISWSCRDNIDIYFWPSVCICLVFVVGQICRREGKELLSFIERLAGTAKLKTEAEEAQAALDDLRECALDLEMHATECLQRRKQLQPQAIGIRKHASVANS